MSEQLIKSLNGYRDALNDNGVLMQKLAALQAQKDAEKERADSNYALLDRIREKYSALANKTLAEHAALQSRIDALIVENAELKDIRGTAFEAALKSIAELEADRERLDWLVSTGCLTIELTLENRAHDLSTWLSKHFEFEDSFDIDDLTIDLIESDPATSRLSALTAENAELKTKLDTVMNEMRGYPSIVDRQDLRQSLARVEQERDEARKVCGEAYFFASAYGAPVEVIDNLSDAAHGTKLRHETFLPIAESPIVQERDALRTALERADSVIVLAEKAMNYLGDILNGMDAVFEEDEDATTEAFDAVQAYIKEMDSARAALDAGEGKNA